MNRRLVLTNEAAGHPFRRMLPPPVFEAEEVKPAKAAKEKWWKKEDTHLFVISFAAFFTVFITFFA